jgi:hypothetical protein
MGVEVKFGRILSFGSKRLGLALITLAGVVNSASLKVGADTNVCADMARLSVRA